MTLPFDSNWRQAADIATVAAELPDEEIEDFLDDECATTELRTEVEALLASRTRGRDESRFDTGAGEGRASGSQPVIKIGRQIGPYRLVRSLGAGGMGEVFLARQEEPIERDVAIKLIRSNVSATAGPRFELERRALARMRHPFIAQIYEAGNTESGQPFLAMEWVDGIAVDRYCDERKSSIEQRLRLFASICDGIHHAHQKGLLHRDVKPENLLVTDLDGEAIPKIIDFGIAKDLDEEVEGDPRYLTRIGGLVGTPAYVSPEAILHPGGDIDIRSDVYSLGILLFRLLIHQLPFDEGSQNWIDLIQRASNEETPLLSSHFARQDGAKQQKTAEKRGFASAKALHKRLRVDLDAIAQKATARDREQRYVSAAALAADIRRYLENRPIIARRASPWHDARKFIRRHRAGALAAAFVVLSLAAGLIARTFEARRADRAAAEAMKAQEETTQVVDFLVSLFEVSDPENSLGATITARELLEEGADRARTELEDQPLARARLLDTIGVVYENLGLYEEASRLLEDGLAAREEFGSDLEKAESLLHLGRLRTEESKTDEALDAINRALELRRGALGPDHPLVAEALDELGQLLEVRAAYREAESTLREALRIREAHFGSDSEPVVETLNNLAVVARNQGNFYEAEIVLTRLLEIREQLHGPDHPEVARALNALANALERQDKGVEAEALFRRSLEIRLAVFGPIHSEVGQSLTNLANALMDQERLEEALTYMLQSLDVLEKSLGETHPSFAIALHNLGDFYFQQGEPELAEPYFHRALEVFTESRGPNHPHTSYPAKGLADVFRQTGRLEEAEALYRRAFEIRFASLPQGNSQVGMTARALAEVLHLLGKTEEAERLEKTYPEVDEDS